MIYCDTSLIVTALTAEPATDAAQCWLSEHELVGLCASPWVGTEVASALAMKERNGALSAKQREAAAMQWRQLITGWRVLAIDAAHFGSAAELTRYGVRAGDALHLAIVLDHRVELATRDVLLGEVATTLGVVVHQLP